MKGEIKITGHSEFNAAKAAVATRKHPARIQNKKIASAEHHAIATTLKITKDEKIEDDEAKLSVIKKYLESALARNIQKEAIADVLSKAGIEKEKIGKIVAAYESRLNAKKAEGKTEEEARGGIGSKGEETGKDEIKREDIKILDRYSFKFMDIDVNVVIYSQKGKYSTFYHMIIPAISQTTELILEQIRLKLIESIDLNALDIAEGDFGKLDKKVQEELMALISESFPHENEKTKKFLVSYLISKVLGLGIIEIMKADEELEEVVVNRKTEPIYVYNKKWGWCASNQYIKTDEQIVRLASMTGRKIGKEITNLTPLLDAHLLNGDRVNATLKPITADSPTITIRKFSTDPWTITKFLKSRTMDYNTASLLWLAIQYELSALVVGGTASGKTSCLNVLTGFIPPNQRIISIEDTREIRLPSYMHWVPMVSRAPNAEGKGAVEMEDLLVNSLRMRPDRIIVGEVRKREQAETLFESIHTGHSVYATFHANNAEEAIVRLTNPPVSVPKTMLPAISLIVSQFRNRRTGLRRTFQVAEITKEGEANVLLQYNPKTDTMLPANSSKSLLETLELYTGSTAKEIGESIEEKKVVLKFMVDNNITPIEQVGKVMALYYTEHDYLMKEIAKRKTK